MNKNTSNEILTILKEAIPNPKCELDYTDAFTLLCAVMLSAQTTDKRVNTITPILFEKYKTIEALAYADIDDVISIIRPLGLASTKAKSLVKLAKMIHEDFNDIVPNDHKLLTTLPGVGRKTANVILAVYFNIPAIAVDTHVHRMAIRLGYIKKTGSVIDAENALMKYIPKEEWAVAHHLFLLFARYNCKAVAPLCEGCKLKAYCKN